MTHVGDHPPYMANISCGPHGYRKGDFLKFSHYKSKRAIDPQGSDKFAPKKLDWQGLCRVPLDIAIHTKCISCDPHGFREDFYVFFFQYKSMGVIGPHGVPVGPQGLDWQDSCCGALDVASY